jgi:hypothetical protein
MPFTTENASEMARKRGRPKKVEETPMEDSAPQPEERPQERIIPLILKRGWFPAEGTVYFDRDGNRQVYKTPTYSDGSVNEQARSRQKMGPGTRIQVPVYEAKPLIDGGKADLDTSL